jgi:hypothetical protein
VAYLLAAFLGLAFGAADQYLGSLSTLGLWASTVSLMSAPWLLLPFIVGMTQERPWRAMALGLLAISAAQAGYFVMTYSPIEIPIWTFARFTTGVVAIATTNTVYILGALVTGPLFGLLGQRWRIRRSRVSAALVAGALCLEPLALWATGRLSNMAPSCGGPRLRPGRSLPGSSP